LEIYTLNKPLSNENLWIAEFWSDDQPGFTFSPGGRWISITKQVVDMEQPPLEKTLETYLKVSFALNDAMVAVWRSKYHYNLLRPETYINQVFDPEWRTVHHTPPFPAYPSGHAMIGAAAAEVLTGLYGDHFQFVDRSHAGRSEFKGRPRSYGSFYDMAFESAFSRIPLGVHYRMDCEEGIRLGLLVGRKVGSLRLKNEGDFTLQ
jgi:membrane-associated phospholipid phosphatase